MSTDQLWQAINPITAYQQGAQFGLINIDLGDTAESDLERKILDAKQACEIRRGRLLRLLLLFGGAPFVDSWPLQ